MRLTESERERITDGVLKIQSVKASLEHIGRAKIPNQQVIDECLESVDISFREALGYAAPNSPRAARKLAKKSVR